MTTLTAFTCVRDGIQFIDAWFENVKKADAIVIQDGGSTDGTVERLLDLRNTHPNVTTILQREDSDKYRWDEAKVRNQCIGFFSTDWTLLTDVDELIEDGFWSWFKESNHGVSGYYIPHKNLWLDKSVYNISGHWYPDMTMRLFINKNYFVWVGKDHGSIYQITPDGLRQLSPGDKDMELIPNDIHIVHYHRAEKGYYDAVMNDKILHHSGEKDNMQEQPMLARLKSHPNGAGLIRKRFS